MLAGAVVLAAALVSPTQAAAKKLNVITATTDLAALAQEVGGDKINVEAMAKGYQDPHFVEAKPSFLLKLQRADLLVVVGLQLEIGWLPPLITQSGNSRIQVGANGYLDASQFSRRSWRFRKVRSRAPWEMCTPSETRTIGSIPTTDGGLPRDRRQTRRDGSGRRRLFPAARTGFRAAAGGGGQEVASGHETVSRPQGHHLP